MTRPRAWLRRLLCRVGWDAACDNSREQLDDERARMRALTWQFRLALRHAIEEGERR